MTIIQYLVTRCSNRYYAKGQISFYQGGAIGAELVDVRNNKLISIDAYNISHIGICNVIDSENVSFPPQPIGVAYTDI